MRLSRLWPIFFAFVIIAAACGSGGDDTTTAEGGSETTASGDSGGDSGDSGGDGGGVTGDVAEVTTDFGVTDEEIRIGYNTALTGIFAATVAPIAEATEVYWEFINDNGGIGGRKVNPVILDSAYEVPKHLENNELFVGDGAQSVVMIGQSSGSPHTAATVQSLEEHDMAAIPLTWYSGWADPEIGANVFEVQTNYCMEAMNGVAYLSENFGKKVAVISFPGEYGQDGAQGAKKAIEALGLELVYDGEAQVDSAAGSDQSPIVNEIVSANPDFVWATVNPTKLSEIMGGAVQQGYTGMWSGNSPTYFYQLLGSELADALDKYYVHSTYTALWNTEDTPGMTEVVAEMRKRRPDAPVSDLYLLGWINGIVVKTILEKAIENGDMTRAGVLKAAGEVDVDLEGLSPNQTWAGDPNDYIVRQSYLYDVDKSLYTGDASVTDEAASTGFKLIQGPFASDLAQNYDFQGACFVAEG